MPLKKEQQPVRIHGHAHEQDHGDDELLAPRHRHEARPRGEEVGAVFLRESEGGGDGAGRVGGVGVGEKKKVAGGLLRELVAGPAFARPAGRQRRAVEDLEIFAEAAEEVAGAVGGVVVACAQKNRADLLSAWPRLVTVTWGEQLIVPMILLIGMTLYPHWLLLFFQRHPHLAARLPASVRRAFGVANGQFMFFTRAGYERVGGHAAERAHVVEDLALGRAVASRMGEGLRLFNCESLRFSTVRMYRSLGETWAGFTKNIRAGFEDSLAGFLAMGAWLTCGFLLPFVFAFCTPRPLVFAQLAVVYLIRILLTVRFRTSWLSCVLHPVGQMLALGIGLNSWRRSAGGGVSWKGRTYQVRRGS